ncbi:SIP domain-containing protein [Streptomyces sp. LP05-1]|uniref:SIP domain-containing protein n=1 Tax=Streptomyces pyxinae TaxID=2970734 RepID=A0ABT2CJ98_9ACTN|nr:siderophore-interacting protein [Streptomyces sp. LP05-1]MCS0637499.1 SIP domain-containing protein [Streptomyces sp. LP05-1]
MSARSPRPVVTFPIVLRELTVVRTAEVTPGMLRITLGGEQLRAFRRDGLDLPALRTEGFDDHVKFFFPDAAGKLVLPRQDVNRLDWPPEGRPVAKDYTPVRFDPEAGEIDFDFVRHAGGVASGWAERARPGESAWIAGPKMSQGHPEGADWLLVLGDETALPAIGRWLGEMPRGTRARVFVEVADPSHRQELPTEADAEVTWLCRDGAPAGTTDLLERAVREMEWLPGTVFVWAAGEAVTLKGVRRHLSNDRWVPRENTHITGYWRRTEPAPGAAGAVPDEDEARQRLYELTDLAPGLLIRSAVTLGLIELLAAGVCDGDELARRCDVAPSVLAALASALVAYGVLAEEDGGYRLTPVGDELAEDDHATEEYHLDGARAALDLSLLALPGAARTGASGYRTADGRPLAAAIREDARLGAEAWPAVEEDVRWVAPGLVGAYDWAALSSLTVAGNGVGSLVNALVKAAPELRVRIGGLPSALRVLEERVLDTEALSRVELVPSAGPVPAGTEPLLVSHLLDWLPDDDAVQTLAEVAAGLPAGGTLLLVEAVRPGDLGDVDVALHHLRLLSAFGSGLRSVAELEELAGRAGLVARDRRDLGWDHRLWVLEPARGGA